MKVKDKKLKDLIENFKEKRITIVIQDPLQFQVHRIACDINLFPFAIVWSAFLSLSSSLI
jgi:hypothetical protein